MSPVVAVVGASGRVGRAMARHLRDRYEVIEILRSPDESVDALAERAVIGADVVVNAAGVAHLERPTSDDLARLRAANVDLPAALARAALGARVPLVYISSVKAASPDESAYASSKRDGELALEALADQFASVGLAVTVIRPLALLFPPLDAGKVRRLRVVRIAPSWLVPAVRLPVLSPATFLGAVEVAVDRALTKDVRGFRIVDFGRDDRGTLRDVRAGFVN